jgi:hypothetical protein
MSANIDDVSESFCLAKYLQLSLHLQNGHNHSCHHPPTHKISPLEVSVDPSALHNTRYKKFIRSEMRKGIKPSECDYCWRAEEAGLRSDRHLKSEDYWAAPFFSEVRDSGDGAKILPRYLEVAFENACNFKCIYCSPQFSSRWTQEILEFGPYPTSDSFGNLKKLAQDSRLPIAANESNPYVEAFWKWWPNLRSELRVLRITGGEPLLSRHTWRIFEDIVRDPLPKLELALNSNFGVEEINIERLAEQVERIQGKVSRFVLFVSLDTVGKQAEYLRYGLGFEQFQKNLRTFLSLVKGKQRLTHMVTVNALSLSGLTNLLRSIIELKQEFPQHSFGVDLPYLRHPSYLSMWILPKSYGHYLQEALTFAQEHSGPDGFDLNELKKIEKLHALFYAEPVPPSGDLVFRDFFRFIQECDRRRKLDFSSVFPEYVDFYRDCGRLDSAAIQAGATRL